MSTWLQLAFTRPPDAVRGRLALAPAAMWALLSDSAWVGVVSGSMGLLLNWWMTAPVLRRHGGSVLGLQLLLGGTIVAIGALTGRLAASGH